jgi:cobalt/nickel transport system permease protein
VRDRAYLLIYLTAVVAATCVHDLRYLAAGIVLVGFVAGGQLPGILRRALVAIAVFNSIVTVSYCLLAIPRGSFSVYYVALINLRVLLLTSMTFLLGQRVNLFAALSFSPTLLYLLTIAYGQIITFRRLLADFRLGLESRSLRRPRLIDLYRHSAATAAFFLKRSHRGAADVTQAMASRGFFHDQG